MKGLVFCPYLIRISIGFDPNSLSQLWWPELPYVGPGIILKQIDDRKQRKDG
jgi:hypothetical protein